MKSPRFLRGKCGTARWACLIRSELRLYRADPPHDVTDLGYRSSRVQGGKVEAAARPAADAAAVCCQGTAGP